MQEMSAGDLRVRIDENTGGAIESFSHAGFALFRPVADFRLEAEHGRAVGAYPLIPYANRVADARFSFGGQDFQLGLNFAGHPHSLHGNAWMRVWTVVSATPVRVHLSLDYLPPAEPITNWPFAYRAELDFALDAGGLTVDISIRNDDARPFPAGIGLHPYVAREPGTLLQFDADTVWRNGPDDLPMAREAVSHHWDFTRARALTDTKIDECYAGWGGSAHVTWPARDLSLTVTSGPPFDHLQLYTPPGHAYFGLEPVSNMPDAVNRMEEVSDNGLRVLAPGETLAGRIRFDVESKAVLF
jgi:aldose 1-epimerase